MREQLGDEVKSETGQNTRTGKLCLMLLKGISARVVKLLKMLFFSSTSFTDTRCIHLACHSECSNVPLFQLFHIYYVGVGGPVKRENSASLSQVGYCNWIDYAKFV